MPQRRRQQRACRPLWVRGTIFEHASSIAWCNWGTQRPQGNYCRRAMGDAACAPKNGGLNVHNDSIAARVMGDAARATKLGGATSTTKLPLPGNGGCRVYTKNGGLNVHDESIAARARGDAAGATNLGDSLSTTKLLPPGDGGCRVCAKKNGGLNVHNESIAARARGDAARATKWGDSTSTTKLLPPGDGGCHICTKKWGTQHPQLKYCRSGEEGRRLGKKTGGLNVHNIIAAGRWGMPRLRRN
jgi:hypothetical protein